MVETDGRVLAMESIVAWRTVPNLITWNDRLRCDDFNDETPQLLWPIWSTQTTQAIGDVSIRAPDGIMRPTRWFYTQSLPQDDRECFIRSTITILVNGGYKSQTVESPVFVAHPSTP